MMALDSQTIMRYFLLVTDSTGTSISSVAMLKIPQRVFAERKLSGSNKKKPRLVNTKVAVILAGFSH
jgi:hypothetical protein